MHPKTALEKVLFISLLVLLSTIQATIIYAGTFVWTSNGPEGGDIQVLTIDPATPTTLYAGTWGGAYLLFTRRDIGFPCR